MVNGMCTHGTKSMDWEILWMKQIVISIILLAINKVDNDLTVHDSIQDAYWCENGTNDASFKSIAKAQQALRTHRSSSGSAAAAASSESVTIAIAAGTYPITQGLVFTTADASDAYPTTTYRGIGGNVVLSGGVDISSLLKHLSMNGSFKTQLLDQSAAPHILQADLSQTSSIPSSTFDAISTHGYSLENNRPVAPTMLYSQNDKMTLSRWRNENDKSYQSYLPSKLSVEYYPGQLSYDTVTDRGYQKAFKNDPKYTSDRYGSVFETGRGAFTVKYGGRLAKWNIPNDIYLDGVLGRAWEWTYNIIDSISSNTIVRLTCAELSGILEQKASHFHFDNIPEELNDMGEFYLDRGSKMLYFYPPTTTTTLTGVVLATLTDTMVTVNISSIGANGLIIDGGSDADIKSGQLVSHDIVAADNQAIGNKIRSFANYDDQSSFVTAKSSPSMSLMKLLQQKSHRVSNNNNSNGSSS